MRKPVFLIALLALLLAALVEAGSSLQVTQHVDSSAATLGVSTAGKAIPAMVMLDGLILFAVTMIGIALILPERLQSKVQGIVTLIFAVLIILATLVILFKDLAQLILMISLLFAPIFGTIAYFAIWANFATGTAQHALSLIMLLKIIFFLCLVISQQRFLKNKGLVLIVATSFLANFLVAFLYDLVPGFLASIGDVVAAIVICIFAVIWAVVYLIGGVISVVKVVI